MSETTYDADGDGYQETTLVDVDQDGTYDAIVEDTNLDGYLDTTWLDADHNGVFEATGVDTNLDGLPDSISTDANQDGIPDEQQGGPPQIVPDNNAVIPPGQPGGTTTVNVSGPPLNSGGDGLMALVNTPQYQTDPEFRHKVDQMLESQRHMTDVWLQPDHDDHDHY